MRDAVTQGPANIQAKLVAALRRRSSATHNGYLLGDIGHYGTDYELRAITDKVGVGALKPKVAIYALHPDRSQPRTAQPAMRATSCTCRPTSCRCRRRRSGR